MNTSYTVNTDNFPDTKRNAGYYAAGPHFFQGFSSPALSL